MTTRNPYALSYLEILATSVVKMGVIPEHVAIIMDGNRRFARKNGMKVICGHESGAEKLVQVMRWGQAVGCKELTVYAFSSENYKRSKEEVDNLMDLMDKQMTRVLQAIDAGYGKEVCVEVIGNWETVPMKLKYRIASIMNKTRHNKPYKLNVALAYTGREGILRSLTSIPISADKTVPNYLHTSQLSEYIVDQGQHLSDMRPVDMLIRTGGDKRISDFMMWEAAHAYIHFTHVSWPEVSFWDFLHSIFMFQLQHKKIQGPMLPVSHNENNNSDVQNILEKSRNDRWARIARLAKKDSPAGAFQNPNYKAEPIKDFITDLLSF